MEYIIIKSYYVSELIDFYSFSSTNQSLRCSNSFLQGLRRSTSFSSLIFLNSAISKLFLYTYFKLRFIHKLSKPCMNYAFLKGINGFALATLSASVISCAPP